LPGQQQPVSLLKRYFITVGRLQEFRPPILASLQGAETVRECGRLLLFARAQIVLRELPATGERQLIARSSQNYSEKMIAFLCN